MIENNNVELLFEARSENEAFARVVAAAFVTYLDPTIEELQDIKTAVSEAVTNAIVHGYDNGPGKVRMRLKGIQNQPSLNRNVQEWDFRLWRHSWMI